MSRYVLTYQGAGDPAAQEELALVAALGPAKVVDRLPGTLLVKGRESDLSSIAAEFKDWSLRPVVYVDTNPPRRRIAT